VTLPVGSADYRLVPNSSKTNTSREKSCAIRRVHREVRQLGRKAYQWFKFEIESFRNKTKRRIRKLARKRLAVWWQGDCEGASPI
jgi:hypothetical protein